jgi:hypothetical protein
VKHPAIAFAALLGGGLTLLWWLDARTPPVAGVGDGSAPAEAAPRQPVAGDRTTYAVRGALESIRYVETAGGGPRPRRYHVRALNSGPTPDGDMELSDFSIELHDPKSDQRVARIDAVRGLIGVEPGSDLVGVSLSNEAQLSEVTIDVTSGTRFAPLRVTTPTAEGDLDAQRFWTKDRAAARGADIDASGQGLSFDLPQGRLVFTSDGTAAITTRDGRTARVHARGELVLLQPPGVGVRPLRVTAKERGRLGLSGPEGIALSANTLELAGAADPDNAATFRFQELVARGEVELHAEGNTFRCREVRFVLGTDGALERVRLVGTVVGEIELANAARAAAQVRSGDTGGARGAGPDQPDQPDPSGRSGQPERPDAPDSGAAPRGRVRLWGHGPMDLRVGAGGRFDLAGPAELSFEGTRLWAEGGLVGRPRGKDQPLDFEAWSGVRVEHGGWTVRTEALTGTWTSAAGGDDAIVLRAPGEARANGYDEDGAPVVLRARHGFELAIDGERWSVPVALGVDLSVGGARPLTATADRIVDFREDPRVGASFTADDHVEVIVDGQFLRGERLVVNGPDDLTVDAADELVSVDGPGLHAEARSLRRRGDTLVAEGDVVARLEREDIEVDLTARTLELSGPLEPGDERPLRLRATGAVEALVELAGPPAPDGNATRTRLELDTADLEVVRRALPDSPFDETVVRARGGLVATVRGPLGDHDVTSRELDVLVVDRLRAVEEAARDERGTGAISAPDQAAATDAAREAAIADLRGTLEARGDVVVTSLAPTRIAGRGDTFFVDHEGRGRLVANPGKRVEARGDLPSTGQPFDVEAGALEFTPTTLSATDTRIHVGDPLAAASGGRATPGDGLLVDLVATARRVRAEDGTLVFEENVSFLGTTKALSTFTLRCGRAAVTTDPPLPGETQRRPRQLVADGGVRIVFSEGIDVEGATLTATAFTQIVRIEGNPAILRWEGYTDSSTYYQIDTLNMLPSGGPGVLLPGNPTGVPQ